MEERFFAQLIHCFFIAFGVLIGGTLIGGIGAFATGEAPFTGMMRIAQKLGIWAIVAAIGGTFDAIENLRVAFLEGPFIEALKQGLLILSAMGGAKAAMIIIEWLVQEDMT
ncbi:YtrH family sporulation protein [Ornithinibacillus halotolerans]|uniref:Sporulation membrane protein YtrH n=1 Tax=Ornithinibacillus halotolerans TaxID=1274357 RepID=A0A916WB22_9BACI|nr:YtrH family sporulation protein [Ornithinibacillus halotolerans]GGA81997.1 sporulation membrane protein YtrH [Ornithinibacillus halotolerans]